MHTPYYCATSVQFVKFEFNIILQLYKQAIIFITNNNMVIYYITRVRKLPIQKAVLKTISKSKLKQSSYNVV